MYVIKQNKKKEWILIKKGAKRATRIFQTKLEAEMYAKAKCPDDYEIEEDEHPTNTTKKAQKKLEGNEKKSKKKKKSRVIFAILFILLLVVIAGGAFLYFNGYLDNIIAEIGGNKNDLNNGNNGSNSNPNPDSSNNNGNNGSNNNQKPDSGNNDGNNGSSSGSNSGTSGGNSSSSGITEDFIYDDFQIHFMELGNANAGDSIYIKAGDIDILIDAGSKTNSVATIKKYLNEYVTDGVLEYVIATHAHEDHIAGMSGGSTKNGILYSYKVENIIDFSQTKQSEKTSSGNRTIYGYYLDAVEYAQKNGATVRHANSFFNDDKTPKDNVINLTSDLSMTILYNPYYFEYKTNENNSSVCTLFKYKNHNFMFTGDAELVAETGIANYYDSSTTDRTLPHVDLFKAGHHGSETSSNEVLLEKITPDICCVCCCAGTAEYTTDANNQFPTQNFIDRIAKYTDRVYVTSMLSYNNETSKWENTSMNGNIIISCDGSSIGVKATNNLIKLKDTEWFNEIIYVIDGKNTSKKGVSADFYTSETDGVTARPRRTWPEI